MALAKPAPVKVVDNQTISASSSYTDATGSDLSTTISLAIGYEMTFNASATEGATIEVYADPDSASQTFTVGTYHDPTDSFDVDVDAGNKAEGMIQVNCAAKYVKIRVVNNDGSQSITGCSVWVQKQTA